VQTIFLKNKADAFPESRPWELFFPAGPEFDWIYIHDLQAPAGYAFDKIPL